jgi:hypothetical protein
MVARLSAPGIRTRPCPAPVPSKVKIPGVADRITVCSGSAIPWLVWTTNCTSLPGTVSGHRIVSSVAEAERMGTAAPSAQTLVPASSGECPDASEAVEPSVNQRPSMVASAPALQAA